MITKFNTDRNTFEESQKRELITITKTIGTARLKRLRYPELKTHIGVHRHFSADSFYSSRLSPGAAAGLGNNITAPVGTATATAALSSPLSSPSPSKKIKVH
jgi:hypothetical protein